MRGIPLNKAWRRKESEDAITPCDVEPLDQSIEGEADGGTAKLRTGQPRFMFVDRKVHLTPVPINTPKVKKRAPIFLTANELRISPPPMMETPKTVVHHMPKARINSADINAALAIQ
ncbi:hypothetical protein QQZ08_009774 [Neonectria magnoliae]|uniref:Uncharacterized protein n=1 Tax=Neonectria magnoliae TaxID=2732573 RepID=A0ABR1HLH3_9HYPO